MEPDNKQEELKVEDIMNDLNFMEVVTGFKFQKPKQLSMDTFVIHFPVSFIHNNIINVTQNALNEIQTKWCKTKSVGIHHLFQELVKQHPETNIFVPVTHTDNDYPQDKISKQNGVVKDKCIMKQRCGVHIHACKSRCDVSFLFSQMFQPGIRSNSAFIAVVFKFYNYTCHTAHKRSVIYEKFKSTESITDKTPRVAQTKALQNNNYNPYSNKHESIPTRDTCRNARYRSRKGNMCEKIKKIQERQIQNTKHKKNIALTFIGDIHCLFETSMYFTFSIWNKMSILFFIKLAAAKEPGVRIDGTENLMRPINDRTATTYKMRVPAPKNVDGFMTAWQCTSNRKDASVFVTSFTSFNENVKQHNKGKTFSPGAITFDGWPPFANQTCLLFNECSIDFYSDTQLKRIRGDINPGPIFNTTLISCFRHIGIDIDAHFDYPTSKEDKKFNKEIRRRVKELGKQAATICHESWNYFNVTNAIQFVNIVTRLREFDVSNPIDVAPLFWNHPILGSHNPSKKLISFEFDEDMNYYSCEIFDKMVCFIVNEGDQYTLFYTMLGFISQRGVVTKTSQHKYSNDSLYMPRGANYLNNNIFDKLAFFSVLSIGARISYTNQFIEGSFRADKHNQIEVNCKCLADEYAQSEVNTLNALNLSYIKECQNAYSKKIKNVLDQTHTSKPVLSKRERRIHEQFDRFVRIIQKGKYNRKSAVSDYHRYYKNKHEELNKNNNANIMFVPIMDVNKISELRVKTKNISTRNNYSSYVEEWLTDRVGPIADTDSDNDQ
eukprot:318342_1